MIKFKVNCELKFEAEDINCAREKLKELVFFLGQLHQTELYISETENLFSKEDLV